MKSLSGPRRNYGGYMRRLWRLYEKEEKARDRSVTDGSDNKKRRKGGRALYYHVESVACLLFTIVLIVATRAIIYLPAFRFPQKYVAFLRVCGLSAHHSSSKGRG